MPVGQAENELMSPAQRQTRDEESRLMNSWKTSRLRLVSAKKSLEETELKQKRLSQEVNELGKNEQAAHRALTEWMDQNVR